MTESRVVLVFEPDLLFSSKIESEGGRLGAHVSVVTDFDRLVQELTGNLPRLIVLNLDALEGKLVSLKGVVSGKHCISLGYGSHTNRRLAEEARQSGISVVMSRGEFVNRIQDILANALSA